MQRTARASGDLEIDGVFLNIISFLGKWSRWKPREWSRPGQNCVEIDFTISGRGPDVIRDFTTDGSSRDGDYLAR